MREKEKEMKKVVAEIPVRELIKIAHVGFSDKVLEGLLAEKGVDITKPYIVKHDHTTQMLICEQE